MIVLMVLLLFDAKVRKKSETTVHLRLKNDDKTTERRLLYNGAFSYFITERSITT